MRILFENLLLDNFIMSRRTAPTAGRQQQQQRTPQPSIRSSQAFAPQPTREQTQYQQMNAKKQLQQQQKDYQEENDKLSQGGTTKITVAQAITLITLRLGSIETKLMNGEFGSVSNTNENIDSETLINVSNRLDALESKINSSSSSDYKQQIDSLTQALIQSKNISNTLMKEDKDLKAQMTNFKKEMTDIKELIENVKNLATSNESKIYQMLNVQCDFQMEEGVEISNENDLNLSDSEAGSILETDIRQSLSVTGYEDNDEELNMTKISELQEQNQLN